MLTRKDYTGLRITVFSHQRDGQRIRDLASRFAACARAWFSGAVVVEEHGEPSLSVEVQGLDDRTLRKLKPQLEAQAKLYRYLDEVLWHVADIDAKFKIQRVVLDEICKNYEKVKFAWTFFRSIDRALSTDVTISLGRMFEKGRHRDETYNLYDFLRFVHRDIGLLYQFPPHPVAKDVKPVTKESVMAHVQQLDKFDGQGAAAASEQLIKKLMHYRDTITAHHDKAYFLDISRYPDELKLMTSDIERLIETAKQILAEYYLAFFGASLTIEYPTAEDVKRVFERLYAYREIIATH